MKFDKATDLTAIPALPTNGKPEQFLWDEDLTGFGLRVRDSGSRMWVCQYRSKGRTRRVTLGPLKKLKPEQARKAAEKHFAEVLLGGDPSARKQKEKQEHAQSLLSVANLYLAAKAGDVRPRTMTELKRYLTDPAYFVKLHRAGVGTIVRKDVAACVTHLVGTKGRVTASRARAALSAMYVWAMGEGLAETNPVAGSNTPTEPPPRDRVLQPREIAAMWKSCGDSEFGKVVRLLLATGLRKSEIGGMRWSEIDLAAATLTIPKARSKNGREHKVPLSSLAVEVIKSIPSRDNRDLVFGARNERGFSTWHKTKQDLDQRARIPEWRIHDLRRTFATGLGDLGIEPHVIECCLNHVGGFRAGVAGTYNYSKYGPAMRQAVELWADHLRSVTTGASRKVVAIHRSAG
jgi:integrase